MLNLILIFKSDSYVQYKVDSNEKDPKFKVGGHVRISKYKKIFAKGYSLNWLEEVLLFAKLIHQMERP